jgi:hypothetical protein
MRQGLGRILPVCVPEVDKADLPEPLSRLQALSLGKADETKLLFQTLVDLFEFGNMKGFKASTIKTKLPKYNTLPVAETDLRAGSVYNGPYDGYSTDELSEVIDDSYARPAWKEYRDYDTLPGLIRDRALVHFRSVDAQLELPPGTAKRLLANVMTSRYPIAVAQRTDNTIRFGPASRERYDEWRAEHGYS